MSGGSGPVVRAVTAATAAADTAAAMLTRGSVDVFAGRFPGDGWRPPLGRVS